MVIYESLPYNQHVCAFSPLLTKNVPWFLICKILLIVSAKWCSIAIHTPVLFVIFSPSCHFVRMGYLILITELIKTVNIYLVGGAVRDELLGFVPEEKDWLVTGATVEQLLSLGFSAVGKDFPVFLHPETKEEYALARTERKAGHGYGGFTFHTAPEVTVEQDLYRRDLTINAMAKDADGNLIDPYNGSDDLKNRKLRHVSPAFIEDPLRVLRVARFSARFASLGFTVADETLALMKTVSLSGELQYLAKERIWQETLRAVNSASPDAYFLYPVSM